MQNMYNLHSSLSVLNYLSEKKSNINLISIFFSLLPKVNELWIAVIATMIGCMFGVAMVFCL